MSNQSPQAIGNRTRDRKRVRAKAPRVRPPEPTSKPARTAPAVDADLEAQRALLADPATIAGTAGANSKSRGKDGRFQPRRAPIKTAASPNTLPAPAQAPATVTATVPSNRTALLDATRAQRLAREARLREHDSREALARARETFEPATTPAPEVPVPTLREPTSTWQRVPLAPASAIAPAPAPAAERALAAELRESRATLAIARETTKVQRDEIARLRGELATAIAALAVQAVEAQTSSESFASRSESIQLRDRIATLEADREQLELEKLQLVRALAANETELAERASRLEALQERYEVQEQALDLARRQSDQERRRHTEAQALLERLRSAVREIEAEESMAASAAIELPPDAARTPEPAAPPVDSLVRARSDVASSKQPSASRLARPAIFDVWRAEQIRRNFGPLGIDTLADLLSAPLERRAQAGASPLAILLVGNGASDLARPLAEDLLRIGAPAFVLHVADPIAQTTAVHREEDPLRDTLQVCPAPESPEALGFLLRTFAPAAVVSRDFLTWQPDPDRWLGELAAASASGTSLLFLEETGHGEITPSAEVAAVGERIWELLPERYTRAPGSGAPVESFREAFAGRPIPPRNELLRRLRRTFDLELCAQFGFLAEAFISGPIAACFDADAARDQRFLKQIADLDERRLESGSAAALHLIARVDPFAAR